MEQLPFSKEEFKNTIHNYNNQSSLSLDYISWKHLKNVRWYVTIVNILDAFIRDIPNHTVIIIIYELSWFRRLYIQHRYIECLLLLRTLFYSSRFSVVATTNQNNQQCVRNRPVIEPVMLKVYNVKLSFNIWLVLYMYFILYS